MKNLLKFVEIKTKITSILTFLFVLSYFYFKRIEIDLFKTLIFFLGLLFIDLFATAINNYYDTKKNNLPLSLSRQTAKSVLFSLLILSIICGIYLIFITDIFILFLGGFCFLFGILYSYGPLPFSHTPFGEVLSGFFYGFMIPFLLFYINIPDFFLLNINNNTEQISLIIPYNLMFELIILSIIPFCLTANIMLANNICDLERDVSVGRYTLVHYISKQSSLRLFAAVNILVYIAVVFTVLIKIFHPITLFTLLTIPFVHKNTKSLYRVQIKTKTFAFSIKNFILILGAHILFSFIAYLFSFII